MDQEDPCVLFEIDALSSPIPESSALPSRRAVKTDPNEPLGPPWRCFGAVTAWVDDVHAVSFLIRPSFRIITRFRVQQHLSLIRTSRRTRKFSPAPKKMQPAKAATLEDKVGVCKSVEVINIENATFVEQISTGKQGTCDGVYYGAGVNWR
jgi:hypothetical protein